VGRRSGGLHLPRRKEQKHDQERDIENSYFSCTQRLTGGDEVDDSCGEDHESDEDYGDVSPQDFSPSL